jgi:F-type H+-transporting ATPase subunit alpha
VTIIYAAVNGHMNDVEVSKARAFEEAFHRYMDSNHPEILKSIAEKKTIEPETEDKLKAAITAFKDSGLY